MDRFEINFKANNKSLLKRLNNIKHKAIN